MRICDSTSKLKPAFKVQNFCDFSLDAKHSITEILNSWCQIGTWLEIWYLSIYGNLYFAYMCILINTMDNIKLNLRHVYIVLKYDMITCCHPESVIQITIQSLTTNSCYEYFCIFQNMLVILGRYYKAYICLFCSKQQYM